MRKNKFKAWDKVNKCMYLDNFFIDRNGLLFTENDCYDLSESPGISTVLGAILIEYIGRNDKNDKEIYNGDIILDKNNRKHIVEWEDSYTGFSPFIYQVDDSGDWISPDEVEVIGNKYENTELAIDI